MEGPTTGGGTPPRQAREQSSRATLRFVLSVAVALAAVLLLYVLNPGIFSAPVVATPQVSASPTPTPTPRPKPRRSYPYIGGTRRIDNVLIKVVRVQYTHGSGTDQANQGNVYAVVTLRIENQRGQDYSFVPNVNCGLPLTCNFYVLDRQGEKNPPVRYDPYHTALRAVVLQDGGYQIGSYTFEVPERDARAHTLQLLYYHDPIADANSVAHWLLQKAPTHGR